MFSSYELACVITPQTPESPAVYEGLETGFPETGWSSPTSLGRREHHCSPRETIETYLRDYSADLRVAYNTEVVDAHRRSSSQAYDWKTRTKIRIKRNGEIPMEKKVFDFVVVVTGTFDKPFVPGYPGLDK
ncbi:hypothetical protein DL768_006325 [Monosporascus sp. mg162]|nr:hypothetical protein DL768_006325 [Monosporascus sp. mg162]